MRLQYCVYLGFDWLLIASTVCRGLQRILEKTIEAEQERAGWGWPDRSEQYLHHTYCFYILDTVRMSFGCKGPAGKNLQPNFVWHVGRTWMTGYDKAGNVRNHRIYGECDTTTGYCRLDSEKFTLMYFN